MKSTLVEVLYFFSFGPWAALRTNDLPLQSTQPGPYLWAQIQMGGRLQPLKNSLQ